tara:strand:+ start:1811 stop:2263 length:453 start_codon:yes stop_codon:yes gene_type:complete
MTNIMRKAIPIAVDFLRLSYTGTPGANPILTLSGSLDNTSATFSGNEFTLYSGSHWRIEASQQVLDVAVSDTYYLDIYSTTNAQAVGFHGIMSTSQLIRGRATSCAMILSSDISTSETFRIQVTADSGDLSASSDELDAYGILKIMELPA